MKCGFLFPLNSSKPSNASLRMYLNMTSTKWQPLYISFIIIVTLVWLQHNLASVNYRRHIPHRLIQKISSNRVGCFNLNIIQRIPKATYKCLIWYRCYNLLLNSLLWLYLMSIYVCIYIYIYTTLNVPCCDYLVFVKCCLRSNIFIRAYLGVLFHWLICEDV